MAVQPNQQLTIGKIREFLWTVFVHNLKPKRRNEGKGKVITCT